MFFFLNLPLTPIKHVAFGSFFLLKIPPDFWPTRWKRPHHPYINGFFWEGARHVDSKKCEYLQTPEIPFSEMLRQKVEKLDFMVSHFAIPKTVVLANKKHRSNVKTPFASLLLVTVFWLIVFFVDRIHFNSLQLFPQSPWQATKKNISPKLPQKASSLPWSMVKTRRPNSIKQHLQHKNMLKKSTGMFTLTSVFFVTSSAATLNRIKLGLDFATRNTYCSIYPLMRLQTLEFKKQGTHDNTCSWFCSGC